MRPGPPRSPGHDRVASPSLSGGFSVRPHPAPRSQLRPSSASSRCCRVAVRRPGHATAALPYPARSQGKAEGRRACCSEAHPGGGRGAATRRPLIVSTRARGCPATYCFTHTTVEPRPRPYPEDHVLDEQFRFRMQKGSTRKVAGHVTHRSSHCRAPPADSANFRFSGIFGAKPLVLVVRTS